MIELKQMSGAELKRWRLANMISVKGCALLFKCRSIQQYYGWESGKIIIPLHISALIPTINGVDIQKVITEKDVVRMKKKVTMTCEEYARRLEFAYLTGMRGAAYLGCSPSAHEYIKKLDARVASRGGLDGIEITDEMMRSLRNDKERILNDVNLNMDEEEVAAMIAKSRKRHENESQSERTDDSADDESDDEEYIEPEQQSVAKPSPVCNISKEEITAAADAVLKFYEVTKNDVFLDKIYLSNVSVLQNLHKYIHKGSDDLQARAFARFPNGDFETHTDSLYFAYELRCERKAFGKPIKLPRVYNPTQAPQYSHAHENRLRELRIALDSLPVTHEEFYLQHESVDELSESDVARWEGIVSDRQQFGEF